MGKHTLFVIVLLLVSISGNCRAGRTRKTTISSAASRGPLQNEQKDEYLRHRVNTGFPYYVSIRSDLYEMHHCAGTLISPHWVLTSAWCMDTEERGAHVQTGSVLISAYSLEVEKKDLDKDRQPEQIGIEEVIIHENYSSGSYGSPPYDARFDVALIRLKNDSKHEPVNLDIEGLADCCNGVDLWNVGFGRASISGPWAIKMEAVKYRFFSFDNCSDHFLEGGVNRYFQGGTKLKEEYSLCVSNEQDQCNLGIGSPLVSRRDGRDVLVGFVTRATDECSYRGDPFVFSNVSAHMEWILVQDDVLKDVSTVATKRRLDEGVGPQARVSAAIMVSTAEFSYSVSISQLGGDLHNCGGALIDPYYVLTAAHCVHDPRDDQMKKFTITIGSDETPPRNGGDHETMELNTRDDVILRERNGEAKDIALVKLRRKSKFDPVKLPFKMKSCCTSNTSLIVLGRGAQTEHDTSSYLHAAGMDFMGRKECMSRKEFNKYPKVSFCAGHESTQGGLCFGDQGSPIVLASAGYEVLIGIATSEVDADCGTNIAQFYRIGFLMKWIKEKLKDEQEPPV